MAFNRLKQKALQKIGAAQGTVDTEFQEREDKFTIVDKSIKTLLHSLDAHTKSIVGSSKTLLAIGVAPLTLELEEVHRQICLAFEHVATEDSEASALGTFLMEMEGMVLKPLQQRLLEHKEIKDKIHEREKLLLDFDAAKQAHAAVTGNHKSTQQKIEASELSLKEAQDSYDKSNAEVLQLLLEGTEKSCAHYHNACMSFRTALSRYHQRVAEILLTEHLEKLEHVPLSVGAAAAATPGSWKWGLKAAATKTGKKDDGASAGGSSKTGATSPTAASSPPTSGFGSSSSSSSSAGKVFGISFEAMCPVPEWCEGEVKEDVPWPVSFLCSQIEQHALDVEGVFRVPSSKTDIDKFRAVLDNGDNPFEEGITDPNVFAHLLKLLFRELPVSLLPYHEVVGVAAKLTEGPEDVQHLGKIVEPLGQANKSALKELCRLVSVVSETPVTKMDFANLATCLAPTIARAPESIDPSTAIRNQHCVSAVVRRLFEEHQQILA